VHLGRSHDGWDTHRKDVEGTYLEIIGLAPTLADRIGRAQKVSPFKGTSKLPNCIDRALERGGLLWVTRPTTARSVSQPTPSLRRTWRQLRRKIPRLSRCPNSLRSPVLAFQNMSGGTGAFFCGISEDIITALIQAALVLRNRAQLVLTYKGKAVQMKQVAEDLGVRYVIEGSVRKSGYRVRITAQLNGRRH
jgi:hypothetical protein